MQQQILAAIINEPVLLKTVRIVQKQPWYLKWLGLKDRVQLRDLYVKNVSMQTFHRIGALVVKLKTETDSDAGQFDLVYRNGPVLASIIACAIEDAEPSKQFVELIMNNFTNAELHAAAKEVYRGLDYDPFYDTMVLFLSLNRTDTQEIPAPGQSSEVLK